MRAPMIIEKKYYTYTKTTCGHISKNIDTYKDLEFCDPDAVEDGVLPFRRDGRDSLYWVTAQHPSKILLVCELVSNTTEVER